jgi:alpha-amylase/alpha-mannosidase (GH57 family)
MKKNVDLVFLWHMHQPDYRDYSTGDFVLPWTYLHAIKDYTDMAYHLEQHPKIRAVVNFVPILLDQIEDYMDQFSTAKLRDPLLRLLAHKNLNDITAEQRNLILSSCFRCHHEKMLTPFPPYKQLLNLFEELNSQENPAFSYLSEQYLSDLLTWYHLVWCGESVKRQHPIIIQLMKKGQGFTHHDRMELLNLISLLISDIIPRYRKLALSGQIEISTTPHTHPLAPLMIDFASALEAMPDAPLPQSTHYPGGKKRVAQHVIRAQQSHLSRFGSVPKGIWPAEGSISHATLTVFAEEKCQWAASGQTVLVNSLQQNQIPTEHPGQYLYRPYHVKGISKKLTCFFRDDKLSDQIGFEYAHWYGADAARHFVAQIEETSTHIEDNDYPIISIILDGENAWEYYPYNGFYFLDHLYTELENHLEIHTNTFSNYLQIKQKNSIRTIANIVSGSWVYGNFATWIGSPDKNKAWDLLCEAKLSYDQIMKTNTLSPSEKVAAELQLCSCESSDWFWWFGDYNSSVSVASFDRLYRHNLRELYRLIQLPPPQNLYEPISLGSANADENGAMRRAIE